MVLTQGVGGIWNVDGMSSSSGNEMWLRRIMAIPKKGASEFQVDLEALNSVK
jgi:hypothetical protein